MKQFGPRSGLRALVLALAIGAAAPVLAQVYKWTGPDGRTHYGDRPPEDARKQELRIGVQSFGGPAEVDTWTRALKRPPAVDTAKPASTAITLFSTSWCPHCKRAKAYFAKKRLDYREVDIEASEDGRREFQAFGGKGVPLIIVGEGRMHGFDPGTMDRMLASPGR